MLLYHPFFDAHHCVFRFLRLLESIGTREVELQRLRIWDFYLLFPEALATVKLPRARGNAALQKKLEASRNSFDVMPDSKRTFARLEPIQQAAILHLAAKGLIDPVLLRDRKVLRTATPIPEELTLLIQESNAASELLVNFLTKTFFSLDLYGLNGVRQRTDLFDHRYDISGTSFSS